MRQRVVALAVTYGLAAATLKGMYILEMVEYATTLLQQQHPKRGEDFFQQAHQLIQDIEIEAAQTAAHPRCGRAPGDTAPTSHWGGHCDAQLCRGRAPHVSPGGAVLSGVSAARSCDPGQTASWICKQR